MCDWPNLTSLPSTAQVVLGWVLDGILGTGYISLTILIHKAKLIAA